MPEAIVSYTSNALTLIALITVIRKASKVKSDMDEATKLQQKDIDGLLASKESIKKKLEQHDERLSNMDMVVAKINAALGYMKETLERIEKKI